MLRAALRWTAIAGGVFLLWLVAVWPPPLWYRTHWPAQTAFMSNRGNALDGRAAGQQGSGEEASLPSHPIGPFRWIPFQTGCRAPR